MPLKVVIVEDNPTTIRSLVQTIDWAALDCEIAGTALDGESGRQLLLETRPDIVLTDIRMPRMDGLQMVEEVRRTLPGTKVIIITGYDQFHYASRAIKLSVFDYILKPIDNDDVIGACRRAAEMIGRERATSIALEQATLLRQRAQLSSLITNDSLRGQGVRDLLADMGLSFGAYYILAMQLSSERLLPQAILNRLDEAVARCGARAVTLLLYDTVVAFVMRDSAGEGWREEAERVVLSLQEELAPSIHAGVSALSTSLHAIRQGYRQACQALWEILLHKRPALINFYQEGDALSGEGVAELRKRIEETIETAELTEASAVRAAAVIAGQSGVISSNLRSMTMLYAMALLRKFPAVLDADCNQALNDIWFVTSQKDVEACLVRLSAALESAAGGAEEKRQSLLVRSALQSIRVNAIEGIRLDDLAETLCVSANYLSTLIRKETGATFQEHVLRARMSVARTMLADPRVLVEEVARAVGYGNYISFYNAFKRVEHMTPTEYRNQRVE